MDRRKFLKGVSGAAVAAVIPISDSDGVSLRSMAHPILIHDAAHHDMTRGFGLAPIKAEGAKVAYDAFNEEVV